MTHEEGELLWQKYLHFRKISNRHHSISRNPLCRMSDRNRKAIFKLVGKPCDMVQVLQMFYEAYDSDEERNEDANNKEELFPHTAQKFEYAFIFKTDGRMLTYYYNYRNSFREGMLTDFWLNLVSIGHGLILKNPDYVKSGTGMHKSYLISARLILILLKQAF